MAKKGLVDSHTPPRKALFLINFPKSSGCWPVDTWEWCASKNVTVLQAHHSQVLKLNLICRKVLINLNNQDIWIYPKQYQERKKKILQKPESLDLQSCPVALKTNESPPVRKCQHFAGDLRQHTNLWDFSTLALISTESCHFWPGMLHKRGICQIFYNSKIPKTFNITWAK